MYNNKYMKNLKKTIMDKGNFLILSKILINNLKSLEAATLLGYLIEQQEFYGDKPFFKAHSDIEKSIFIKRHSYEEAKKLLVEMGLIKTWIASIPGKKRICYFQIDNQCFNNIENMLNDNSEPKANQITNLTQTKSEPIRYVENNKPQIENDEQVCRNLQMGMLKSTNGYVENNISVCRNLQTGMLKSTSNNNINNNIEKEDNNNLLNNEIFETNKVGVEDDLIIINDDDEYELQGIKLLYENYLINKNLDIEDRTLYKELFIRCKEKRIYVNKFSIEEYGIV